MKKGDKVVLKSGGMAMTVKAYTDNGLWLCTWFDKEQKIQEHEFDELQLKEYKPQPILFGEVKKSKNHY